MIVMCVSTVNEHPGLYGKLQSRHSVQTQAQESAIEEQEVNWVA